MNHTLRVLISATFLVQAAFPAAAIDGTSGQFFYRYKENVPISYVPDTEEKDVTAYFVGGVGYEFEEVLPLKPEWQDDTWSLVDESALPEGIVFDKSSLTFRGTPTVANSETVVFLRGVDSNGNQVAEAKVSFDIRTIRGVPVKLDIYAHTGKYKLAELAIPAGITVDSWERVNIGPLPPGIVANGPYFDGTPTRAGQWKYMAVGLNYMGEPVVTFFGNYLVEDRPTFPAIADNVQRLPQLEWGYGLPFKFGAPSTHRVNHVIDPAKPVRYYLEYRTPGSGLPGSVTDIGKNGEVILDGDVVEPYDTAEVRYKAVDSDGVEGWSNWFVFGSSDPQPGCNPYTTSNTVLKFTTGRVNNVAVPRPYGDQGIPTYTVVSGSLPEGITLTPESGLLTGTPIKSGEKNSFEVRIDVANDGGTVSTSCFYNTIVGAQTTRITDSTDPQAMHIRTGDVYSGVASITGGIPTYTLSFENPAQYPEIAFTSSTVNTAQVSLAGPIRTNGTHTIGLKLTNGDEATRLGAVKVHAHGELTVGTPAEIRIKRLAGAKTWGSVPYDATTVIDDVKAGGFPKFSLDMPSELPADIVFSGASFVGATAAEAGTYGPFVATISDFSGDTDTSDPFTVIVEDRDDIDITAPTSLTFVVETDTIQTLPKPTVIQPPLASAFKVEYRLDNLGENPMPPWMSFDEDTGIISAAADIPFADIGTYGPFTITATDSEGSTDTTAQFSVAARDWPTPMAAAVPLIKGTVSGATASGETATWINIPSLRPQIIPTTVIGGVDAVEFTTSEPAKPAGLTWDPSTATFSGRPTEEFNGTVTVGFKDSKGREGTIDVPMEVRQYPVASTTQVAYEIPRLAVAQSIATPAKGVAAAGFWSAPQWSVDTTRGPLLPAGLSIDVNTGVVKGKATDEVGTVATGIVLKATSAGATGGMLESWTDPFSITVTKPEPLTLAYSPATSTFYLNEVNRELGIYSLASSNLSAPSVGGSHVDPLTHKLIDGDAISSGMTGTLGINAVNGVFTGWPDRLGTWNVEVDLSDAEGTAIPSPVPVTIKATLAGDIKTSSGGGTFKLRVEEPFETPPLTSSNYVGSVIYSATPATTEQSALGAFDPRTGAFANTANFTKAISSYSVTVNAKDNDERTFGGNAPVYAFSVIPPLELTTAPVAAAARQYDISQKVDVSFTPSPKNVIGAITYGINGEVPGTLSTLVYDEHGQPTGYVWKVGNARHDLEIDQTGTPTEYSVDGRPMPLTSIMLPDGSTMPAPAETYMPLDALIFDTKAATLRGTASKSGLFPISITAFDNHSESYIKDVDSKDPYNRATSDPMTLSIEEASAFTATSSMTSETVAQYTGQPQTTHVATGGAYGGQVSWSAVSGTLPSKVTTSRTSSSLRYSGYPETRGTYPGIIWKATDLAGREARTPEVTMTVGPRAPLELVAGTNPAVFVVNKEISKAVSAINVADGKTIPASDWAVSGTDNLPPGVAPTISDGKVVFSGIPTVIGTYTATVSAVDGRNGSASLTVTFRIISPEDEIVLSVENIRTKAGYPYEMLSSASNTYGTVRFYSNDISGDLASQLKIDGTTGLVSGSFKTVGDRDFDVFVTDETNRVTSKPVLVNVIPMTRVTVPTIVQGTQLVALDRTVATDYILGTVTYEKDGAEWPKGIEVDRTTGRIHSSYVDPDTGAVTTHVIAAAGTYAGLRIKATDTFVIDGKTYTDAQVSNAFQIQVDYADLYPDIADVSKTILGKVGTTIVGWVPTVVDTKKKEKWTLDGTTYEASHDLTQYGLVFDKKTGRISGTPTAAFIIRNFTVQVKSQRGDTDITKPFWIGVAPKEPIIATAGQNLTKLVRVPDAYTTATPRFENTFGDVTYRLLVSPGPNSFDTNTGILSRSLTTAADIGDWPAGVEVTDEFERKGVIDTRLKILADLVASRVDITTKPGQAVSAILPTVSGVQGTATYSYSALPKGISSNSNTGELFGIAEAPEDGAEYMNSVLTITDDYADAPRTLSIPFKLFFNSDSHLYWRMAVVRSSRQSSGYVSEARPYDADGFLPAPVSSSEPKLFDGRTSIGSTNRVYMRNGQWFTFSYSTPKTVEGVQIIQDTDTYYATQFAVEYSDDNLNWTRFWTSPVVGRASTVNFTKP